MMTKEEIELDKKIERSGMIITKEEIELDKEIERARIAKIRAKNYWLDLQWDKLELERLRDENSK
jgi:hypothetical protein